MKYQLEKIKKMSEVIEREVFAHPFDQIAIGFDVLYFFIIEHALAHED
jgi:hypothetical protein